MKKLSVSLTPGEFFWGWIWLAAQLIILPIMLEMINMLLGNPLSISELNFVAFCINFIAVTVIFRKFLLGCGKISLSQPWRCLRSAGIGLMLYWLLSYLYSIVVYFVSPEFTNVNDSSVGAMVTENYELLAFATVLLVPVAEETLFRGLIFGSIYNRNRFLAYVVSAVAFAALHVIGYIGYYPAKQLLLCFFQYIPPSISLAWAYTKADSIWAPILIHITINQIAILSMR